VVFVCLNSLSIYPKRTNDLPLEMRAPFRKAETLPIPDECGPTTSLPEVHRVDAWEAVSRATDQDVQPAVVRQK
jgi:hypothetical protein